MYTSHLLLVLLLVSLAAQFSITSSVEITCYVSNADIQNRDGSIKNPFASVTQCINSTSIKLNENSINKNNEDISNNVIIFVEGASEYTQKETWDLRLYSKTVNLKITKNTESNEVIFKSTITVQLFNSNNDKSIITLNYLTLTSIDFNSEVDEINLTKKTINIIDSTLSSLSIASQSDAYDIIFNNVALNVCKYRLLIESIYSSVTFNNINDLIAKEVNCSSSTPSIIITVANYILTNSTISAESVITAYKSVEVINNLIYNSFFIVGSKLKTNYNTSNTLIKNTNFYYTKFVRIFSNYLVVKVSTMNHINIENSQMNQTLFTILLFNKCTLTDINFTNLNQPVQFTNGNSLLIQNSSITSSKVYSLIQSSLVNSITLDNFILSDNTACIEHMGLHCNELIMKNCNFMGDKCSRIFAAINGYPINNLTLLNNNKLPQVVCGAGYYTPDLFYPCKPCQPGTMNNITDIAISQCKLCSAGTYQPFKQKSSCELCDVGTYQDKEGSTNCIPCSSGLVATSTGSSTCNQCNSNSYYVNSKTCISCNMFSTAYSNSSSNVGCYLSTTTIVLMVFAVLISLLVIVGMFGGTFYIYKKRLASLNGSNIDQSLLTDNNYGTLNG